MKVVIFCGGLGVRMGEETQRIPKPMITGREPADPLAHHEVVRVVGARRVHPLPRLQGRVHQGVLPRLQRGALERLRALERRTRRRAARQRHLDWRITFVDTGAQSTIAERLLAVAPHLGDDEYFLATYGDGLTDAPLPDMIERLALVGEDAASSSPCVRVFNAHVVEADDDGIVRSIEDMQQADVWINGGFFVLPAQRPRLHQPGRGARGRAVRAADRATAS